MPRSLSDVDIAVVNSNYALGVGLNPLKDSIYLEDKRSPYALVVATRKGDQNDPRVQKLVKALQFSGHEEVYSDEVQGRCGSLLLKRRSSLTGRNPHPGKTLCLVFCILEELKHERRNY
ncbi:MAG: MetQ/NlpA family ABC transporter substrate-binding protein [Dakarella massiliensis]